MVNQNVAFKAEARSAGHKSDLTNLRTAGFIPAVIYSKGNAGEPVQLNEHDFQMMLKHHSGENLMIELQVGENDSRNVLIKEIQHHPMTARIVHVDFHEISLSRLIKVMVTLDFDGTPAGVTNGGGTLDIQTREIEVECKASDLVESFIVDVSSLGIGDHLTVADVKLPEGFELLTEGNISIATVLKPRVAAAEGDSEGEEASGEPEVISAAKDDEASEG
ncbi:50S ribosomal protein L25 [Kiritimatiellaeota bacterium B1221]|nr:50S ribosomal protein L25 [Kiritimatiellaeota bacterium B1221]